MNTSKRPQVLCSECLDPIETNADLVVSWRWFAVRPFHRECYVDALKDHRDFFVGNHVINSWSGDIGAVLSLLLAPLFVIYFYSKYGPLAAFLMAAAILTYPAARFYSWWRYEKRLS